ncbi:arylamine N-acetyltransferase [Nocardioides anomalus]|uniref:Arylamine N-acetyltransferase n=1 Tax=Nocardioides anomalus TaxID=2712223 RepID=A0A6G6WBM6_9ACTN|nr:arylamine N-acetyltransferase [Nocardioides anomalus]QIG42553.1 arylamine N-acetyltransferase [Nocardioides anomalus]
MTATTHRSDAVAAYLRRVGLDGEELPASYDTLLRLHRAHLDAVPYENLCTMLGRPPSVEPADSLARVGEVGRAGYCFHQNGALALVLAGLGFAVTRRHGHVWTDEADRAGAFLNHLVLEVDEVPTPENPDGRWWFDVGLGDAFRDPVPVVVGRHGQDGFDYEVTEVRADGWSFRHDRTGTFTGVEVTPRPVGPAEVAASHAQLTAPGDGRFARVLVVQHRDATGVDTVRGCLRLRTEPSGTTETELTTYDAWRAALTDAARLPLDDVDGAELRALYDAQWAKHVAWDAAGRP